MSFQASLPRFRILKNATSAVIDVSHPKYVFWLSTNYFVSSLDDHYFVICVDVRSMELNLNPTSHLRTHPIPFFLYTVEGNDKTWFEDHNIMMQHFALHQPCFNPIEHQIAPP